MIEKLRFKELITLASSGNHDAMNQLVHRFTPIIKKYSHQMNYDEAYNDLIVWMIAAVHSYKPNAKPNIDNY